MVDSFRAYFEPRDIGLCVTEVRGCAASPIVQTHLPASITFFVKTPSLATTLRVRWRVPSDANDASCSGRTTTVSLRRLIISIGCFCVCHDSTSLTCAIMSALKDLGNEHFKAGKFKEAEQLYTEA